MFVLGGHFRWIRGEPEIETFKLPEAAFFTVAFCRICSSPVPQLFDSMVMVPAGALDQDPGIRPLAHIYVGSKASWFEIAGDLQQFEDAPPR